jgi:uncharacterized protein (TIGR03083 family)
MNSPIVTAPLFRELHGHLLSLLRGLAETDWNKPTVCSLWSVKDIASHLLDGNVRRVAAQRDGYRPPDAPASFASHAELVAYLNRLNADWTAATRRMSPRTLIEMLDLTGMQVAELVEAADPYAPALFAVGWAGETHSLMWLDIAREYTERWHHQRQIADAVGAETPIDARHLYFPVLDTFMRALPYTLRDVTAEAGAIVEVVVTGEAGGRWAVRRRDDRWEWIDGPATQPSARLTIDQRDAWKVFTKRRDADSKLRAFPGIRTEGDVALARRALEMVSIMA